LAKKNARSIFVTDTTLEENSMTAEYKIIGDVAVITMTNPPVNGLGLSTRVGITDGLTKANADAAVKSIIITGAGKAFSGGADIKEFGSSKAVQEPNLLSVIRACENLSLIHI
jgi:3-hydroxyacyl-CoA dehydrogenase